MRPTLSVTTPVQTGGQWASEGSEFHLPPLISAEMVDSASPPTGGGGKQVSSFHMRAKILKIIVPLSFGLVQITRTFGKVFNCHRQPVTILAKAVPKKPAHLE